MFLINDDMSIYVTRGDAVFFTVEAEENGEKYIFRAGDVLRFKAFAKKNCEDVVLSKDFAVTEDTTSVNIILTKEDTKIREVISKPTDYWYEVELNPFTNPQTIIGYDDDGAKVFKLFPEGDDLEDTGEGELTPEDIPFIDEELDLTSTRPVQNQAIARAIVGVKEIEKNIKGKIVDASNELLEEGGIFATMTYDEDTEELNLELLEFAIAEEMVEEAVSKYLAENPVSADTEELIPLHNMNGCIVCYGEEVTLNVGTDINVGQVISFKYKKSKGYSVSARGLSMQDIIKPSVAEDGYREDTFEIKEGFETVKFTGAYFVVIRNVAGGDSSSQIENITIEEV